MLTFIHTSDWHLGNKLYNYDRTEEMRDMLTQMVDCVRTNQPDVFLISGDVYDDAQPSSAVQTMFTNALVNIHEANPEMTIIVTAGNHDSRTGHEIFQTPWEALNVHVVGLLKDDEEQHIIEVPGKGYFIALPYVNQHSLPEGIYQRLLDKVNAQNASGLPVVVMAHTAVRGCDITGHDRSTDYSVGNVEYQEVSAFGTGYDYVALGHIHRPQFVDEDKRIRYSGTPIAISFSEGYEHSVSLVTIDKHGDLPEVQTLPVRNLHPLVNLPAVNPVPLADALEQLKNYDATVPAYIRLNVKVDAVLPSTANADAAAIAIEKGNVWRICPINAVRTAEAAQEQKHISMEQMKTIDPMEIAKMYASRKGITFTPEMEEVFNSVRTLLDTENNKNN